jgi:hypothetical protein
MRDQYISIYLSLQKVNAEAEAKRKREARLRKAGIDVPVAEAKPFNRETDLVVRDVVSSHVAVSPCHSCTCESRADSSHC